MVSAVSSQASPLNPLAYTALNEDDNSSQTASTATPNGSGRGPATQVSLSQDALDRLMAVIKQGPDTAQQAMDVWSLGGDRLAALQSSSEAIHHQSAINQVKHQLKMLDQQDAINESFTASLKVQKDDLEKWRNTTPVPAVQLNEAQIAAILKKVASRGIDPSKIGGADNYAFNEDGMQYTFKKDGTAWVHKVGVPTSEEHKKYVLQEASKSMAYMSTRIQDTSAARANLNVQLNELMGQ